MDSDFGHDFPSSYGDDLFSYDAIPSNADQTMGFDFGQDLATGGLLSTHGELADETDEDGWSRTHVQMLKDFLNKEPLGTPLSRRLSSVFPDKTSEQIDSKIYKLQGARSLFSDSFISAPASASNWSHQYRADEPMQQVTSSTEAPPRPPPPAAPHPKTKNTSVGMKKRHADAPTESERSQKRHKKPKVTETVSEESSEEYEVPEVDSDYSDGDYSEGKSKKKKGSTKAKPPQKASTRKSNPSTPTNQPAPAKKAKSNVTSPAETSAGHFSSSGMVMPPTMPLGYQRAVQAQNRGLAGVPGRVGPGMYPPGYPYGGASPPPYPPSYAAGPGGVPVHGSSPSPPPHLARSDVGANQFAVPNGAPLKRGASMDRRGPPFVGYPPQHLPVTTRQAQMYYSQTLPPMLGGPGGVPHPSAASSRSKYVPTMNAVISSYLDENEVILEQIKSNVHSPEPFGESYLTNADLMFRFKDNIFEVLRSQSRGPESFAAKMPSMPVKLTGFKSQLHSIQTPGQRPTVPWQWDCSPSTHLFPRQMSSQHIAMQQAQQHQQQPSQGQPQSQQAYMQQPQHSNQGGARHYQRPPSTDPSHLLAQQQQQHHYQPKQQPQSPSQLPTLPPLHPQSPSQPWSPSQQQGSSPGTGTMMAPPMRTRTPPPSQLQQQGHGSGAGPFPHPQQMRAYAPSPPPGMHMLPQHQYGGGGSGDMPPPQMMGHRGSGTGSSSSPGMMPPGMQSQGQVPPAGMQRPLLHGYPITAAR